MDIKDIKEAVSDVIQVSEKKWQDQRAEDQKSFDEKVSGAMEKVVADTKSVVEEAGEKMQKQFDELATNVGKKEGNKKGLSFKESIALTLKDNIEDIRKQKANGSLNSTIELKDFNFDSLTGFDPFMTDYSNTPVLNPYSSFHWRNIIPRGTTSKSILKYPKESTTTGAADTWEHEGDSTSSKPTISPTFTTGSDDIQWIAGLIPGIPVDMLEDLPWLTSYLQTKAFNELMKAEDLQIKSGSGTDPDLNGFFTGSNSVAYIGSETKIFAQIIDAAYRQIADAEYNANKAVISNADKVSILLNTETGAGFNLPQGSVSVVNGKLNIAGIELYSTSQMAEGQALIGDFNESAFVIRSAPRLRFFDQNEADATKNQLLLRIEERAALAIYANAAFVKLVPST